MGSPCFLGAGGSGEGHDLNFPTLSPAISETLYPAKICGPERRGREQGAVRDALLPKTLPLHPAAWQNQVLPNSSVKSGEGIQGHGAHSQCLGTGNHQQPPQGETGA